MTDKKKKKLHKNLNKPSKVKVTPAAPTSSTGLAEIERGSLEAIGALYLACQIYETAALYIQAAHPTELAELVACGAISGFAAATGKKEAEEILDPAKLDAIFDESLNMHKELEPLVSQIRTHINNTHELHKSKLDKGLTKLQTEGALEHSFLTLHKHNGKAIERLFTQHFAQQGKLEYFLALKNSLTAGIMTSTTTTKEGSFALGEGIGYQVGALVPKMKSYISAENSKKLEVMVEKLTKGLKFFSPVAYAGYQIHKTVSKITQKGMQAALLPVEVGTVAVAGALSGFMDTRYKGKRPVMLQKLQNQSWRELSTTALTSSATLLSNTISDWLTAYKVAYDKLSPGVKPTEEAIKSRIMLKPHKKSALFAAAINVGPDPKSLPEKAIIYGDVAASAAINATRAVMAKNTFSVAKNTGQMGGHLLNYLTKSNTQGGIHK